MDCKLTTTGPTWLRRLGFALLPGVCLLCGRPSRRPLDLCAPCDAALPWIDSACRRCALPLPAPGTCGQCLQRPPPFAAGLAPCHHAAPVDGMIQRLKYSGDLAQAAPLAALIAARVRERDQPLPEALVPVPLHWRRQVARGFNQALELALPLGRALGIPVRDRLVRRVRATPHQVGLSRAERRRNLARAFVVAADSDALPRHLALVDDVITTGSTVEALAGCLQRAGVERIEVWAVSRAGLAN